VRRIGPAAVAAALLLVACEPTGGTDATPTAAASPAPPPSASPSPAVVGSDPLVTWSPQAQAVGERSEGWLGEPLLVTASGDVRLVVTPVSTSMTLEYVNGARSLAIWIEVENAGDASWRGVLGANARLTDEFGNVYVPIASPTSRDVHPNPDRYGYSNRNLMRPIGLAPGERRQGVLVFRPTLGNRPATLTITLDDERTTSWVVNIGQF
jgi:hypothetical protein